MGLYGGLRPEDWQRWGQFTTLKTNAAELLSRRRTGSEVIYCSPLVDPYQPVEREHALMQKILAALIEHPPAVFVIQTRGTLILRDLAMLRNAATAMRLRISFSITTDREDVRRRYEPHCEPNEARLEAISALREAGLEVYATLAPLLPSNPERLAQLAIEASGRSLIGDPLHVRETKPQGATTRAAAFEIARRHGESDWFCPEFQRQIVERIRQTAIRCGVEFATGTEGFGWLARG